MTKQGGGVSQQGGSMSGAVIADPSRPPTGPPPSGVGMGGRGGGSGGGGADGRGPGRSRRRRLLVAAGVVVLLVPVLVLLAPTSLINPYARRAVSGYGGSCAELVGVDVDSGAWPVVARAAAGRHRDVATHVDELRVDGFTYYDVSFSAREVVVAPLFGLLSDRETVVRGGESSATARFDDIEAVIASYGTTVDLSGQGSTLVANVEVPLLGPVPTSVGVTSVDGDMELVFAPLDLVVLPPVRIPFPELADFRSIEVAGDAIRIDVTVEGPLRSEELGCDAPSNTPQ
jgi:hypothetical protein